MRPLQLLGLLALAVVLGGSTWAEDGPRQRTKAEPQRRRLEHTVVEVGVKAEDAEQVAYRKARQEVLGFLHQHNPPLAWHRSAEELDEFVVKDSVQTEEVPDQKMRDLGFRYQTTLKVKLEPGQLQEIAREHHRAEVGERHWLIGKILAGLVVLLGTIAVYFRLDEWTKGYYTTLLRLAAATVLASALGGLLLLP
jgi:hypothetical protein